MLIFDYNDMSTELLFTVDSFPPGTSFFIFFKILGSE